MNKNEKYILCFENSFGTESKIECYNNESLQTQLKMMLEQNYVIHYFYPKSFTDESKRVRELKSMLTKREKILDDIRELVKENEA
jgi:hypothetical protein